jgi:GNAT superfamily N-acetyltransferase
VPRLTRPLTVADLDAAAALVVATHGRHLPRLADPTAVRSSLKPLAGNGISMVAGDGERLTGLLAAVQGRLFGSIPLAYAPEFGVAATPTVLGDLYAAASVSWLDRGLHSHGIGIRVADTETRDALVSLGFGHVGTESVWEPTDSPPPPEGVVVRPVEPDDAAVVAELTRRVADHLAAAPTFLPPPSPADPQEAAEWIAGPGTAGVVAFSDGEPVGLLGGSPSAAEASLSIAAPDRVHIDRAFVVPRLRRRGLAAALLGAFVLEARVAGYGSCSVDYEAANREGAGFWEGVGFRPVLHSMVRTVPRAR